MPPKARRNRTLATNDASTDLGALFAANLRQVRENAKLRSVNSGRLMKEIVGSA
jgi:hypothetical protein